MLKEIIISIQAYYHTHHFIIRHRMWKWKWFFIPGLIYAILFCLGIYLFWISSSSTIEFMLVKTGIKEWMQKMQNNWLSFFLIFGLTVTHLVLMMIYFSLFKYLFLIIGSPLFAWLSEKTEAIIEGKDLSFDSQQFFKDIKRGVRLSLRNMLWQSVYSVSILMISFIPVLGWITPVILLVIECYYLGFSMLDHSFERNKISTTQSIAFMSRHKGLAIGNGMVFILMHLLPIIGWILAPYYSVIAATISLFNTKTDNPIISKEII